MPGTSGLPSSGGSPDFYRYSKEQAEAKSKKQGSEDDLFGRVRSVLSEMSMVVINPDNNTAWDARGILAPGLMENSERVFNVARSMVLIQQSFSESVDTFAATRAAASAPAKKLSEYQWRQIDDPGDRLSMEPAEETKETQEKTESEVAEEVAVKTEDEATLKGADEVAVKADDEKISEETSETKGKTETEETSTYRYHFDVVTSFFEECFDHYDALLHNLNH